MPLEKDTLLNSRYRIQDTLGKGGMGAVYVALDESLGVHVALKENLLEDDNAIQQFRREATILAGLRHPNLPRVTDHFVIEGQGQYLVMDFIEGEDMKTRLQRVGALPEKEVLLIGIAISDALNYLHTLTPPVLHRDIKPGNIRITSRGEVYLVDFGLAKQVESGQATATGARGLTPGYSPPEQYGTARTDARSDIYALGATLYTALAGFPPEDGLAVAINQTKLTPIRQRNPKTSQQAAIVIEKALEVNSEDRYQSGNDFKEKLLEASETITRQVAAGDVTVTPPPEDATVVASTLRSGASQDSEPSIHPPQQPDTKKPKTWLWGVGVVAVLVIVGLAVGIPRLSNKQPSTTPIADAVSTATQAQADTPTIEPTEDNSVQPADPTEEVLDPTATQESAATAIPAPTSVGGGGMLAFASDRDGEVQIYLMDMVTQEVTQLTTIGGGACQPTWSPDGMRLAFTAPCSDNQRSYDGSTLFIINIDGSGTAPLTFSPIGDYDPAWSQVGNQIAFTTLRDLNRPQIWILDMDSNELTNISDNAGSGVSDFHPSWSPDGQSIVFSSIRGVTNSPNVWVMDTNGENLIELSFSNNRTNLDPDWASGGNIVLYTQFGAQGGGVPAITGMVWRDGNPRAEDEFHVSDLTYTMREPAVSPDGFWVAFSGGPGAAQSDLYFMRINGSEVTQLTDTESQEFDPAWRPIP